MCNKIAVYSQKEYRCSDENIKALRKVLIDNKIDIIINQWGLPYVPILVAHKAANGLNIKIISIHHNDPSANGKLYDCNISISNANNEIKKIIFICKNQ